MTDWRESTPRDRLRIEPAEHQPTELEIWSGIILDGCWIAAAIITAGLFLGFIYARYF